MISDGEAPKRSIDDVTYVNRFDVLLTHSDLSNFFSVTLWSDVFEGKQVQYLIAICYSLGINMTKFEIRFF